MPTLTERPNVLLLFTDQLRADALGAYGNKVVKTPHVDRLASEGTRFDCAYTPSPVCISARCSLQYGQYPWHTSCYGNAPMPDDQRHSFVGALTDAGYRTHAIGKCHFTGDDQLRGFQSRETQEEIPDKREDDDYLNYLQANGLDHVHDPHGVRGEMYYIPQPAQMSAEHHPTQWIGNRTIDFIERRSTAEPWYLFSSFIHPHPPFAPPTPWHKLYRAPLMPLPNLPADHESLWTYYNRFQNRYKYRDQGIDQNLLRNMKAYYYACVSFIDYQIGRIRKALERKKMLDNTLILFASDHGEYLGDYQCFGKRGMHDASARIPIVARHPKFFKPDSVSSRPVSLVDFAPTILDVTGTEWTHHALDGEALHKITLGQTRRTAVYAQFGHGSEALYMQAEERWKYIYSAPDHRGYLFDRYTDPFETRNKSGLSLCRQTESRMLRELLDTLIENNEVAGIENGAFKSFPICQLPENPDAGLLIQDQPWSIQLSQLPGYTN